MPDIIESLIEEFSRLPGVGPRQARRFAFYMLTRSQKQVASLSELLLQAKRAVSHCTSCGKLFVGATSKKKQCVLCADASRDNGLLMIVGHDVDIESIEKSGGYHGHYFVLGGTIPLIDEKPEAHIRITPLRTYVLEKKKVGLKEIILALDANPEGEHTSMYVRSLLTPLVGKEVRISVLGRGLSTGTELQYSDPETITSALKNRT